MGDTAKAENNAFESARRRNSDGERNYGGCCIKPPICFLLSPFCLEIHGIISHLYAYFSRNPSTHKVTPGLQSGPLQSAFAPLGLKGPAEFMSRRCDTASQTTVSLPNITYTIPNMSKVKQCIGGILEKAFLLQSALLQGNFKDGIFVFRIFRKGK